ncbi:MAG: hypothetical protein AAB612_03135 [Patescibacteria group bacterium]
MIEEVVFRFSAKDFFKDLSDPKISIMMTSPFLYAVKDIVEKICGDRMKHPLTDITYYKPELLFIVSADTRDIFLRTFNTEIAPAIIQYLSSLLSEASRNE